ncbi:hypothetical protein LSH36_288g04020 [Paralvinella palmiformis]|uniref:G-protein coupled receptors family 1 profile domain-containing protein n=1 Tax=Paralvinella palmiformis TaxID=53620 RepID=A0AAD9JJA6_9ANNE|nr:hypothetical protein LSH36_288g04020 [Paralvinella palmiformis]
MTSLYDGMTLLDVDVIPLELGIKQPGMLGGGVASFVLKFDWIINVVIFVVMVTSLIGNSVIIYVICTRKRSRTAQNISIVSLCVSAILTASFVMPSYLVISMYNIHDDEEMCKFLCKLEVYVCYWSKTVMAYSLCALVFDRYSLVIQTTKISLLSGQYMFFLSFVWFFGAAYNIWDIVITLSHYVIVTAPDGHNLTLRRCVTSERFDYIQNGIFYSDVLIIYVVPSIIICYMYSAMIYFYCCRQDSTNQRLNKKKILLSVSLLLSFYVCQLPLEILNCWGFFTGLETFELMMAKRISEIASFLNGLFIVIIYTMFSSDLHALFRRKYSTGMIGASRCLLSTSGGACVTAPKIRVTDREVRTKDPLTSLEMTVIVLEDDV